MASQLGVNLSYDGGGGLNVAHPDFYCGKQMIGSFEDKAIFHVILEIDR